MPQQYAEVEQLASQVSAKAQFPLLNFGDLASALGGEDTEVKYKGKGQKLADVKKRIPDGFFPVESKEDLIVKIAYLQTLGQKPADDHTPGEQKNEPKADAGNPPQSTDIGKPRHGGLPALSGAKKG
jgi:hypothetical protein